AAPSSTLRSVRVFASSHEHIAAIAHDGVRGAVSHRIRRAQRLRRLAARVAEGRDLIRVAPWVSVAPGLAVGVAVLGGCRPGIGDGHAAAATRIEWPSSAGDAGSLRYSPAADITRDNVVNLAPAWTWRTGETAGIDPANGEHLKPWKFEATPIMLGDTLFLSTPFSRAVALDARTGRQFWAFDPDVTRWGAVANDHSSFVHRGVAVWTAPGAPSARRVFLTARWQLFALDAATGQKIESFGDNGSVDLGAHLR